MIALYIVLGALLLLTLLLVLPIGARYRFNGEGYLVVRYAGIPIYIYSSKAKKAEKKPKKAKKKQQPKRGKATKGKPQKEGTFKQLTAQLKEDGAAGVLTFAQDAAQFVGGTVRHLFTALRFGKCRVRIVVGSVDAAETALRYGQLAGPIYAARSVLLSVLRVRDLQFEMYPDFLAEKDTVIADIRLHTNLLALIWLVICRAISGVGLLGRYSNTQSEDGKNGKKGQ